MIYAIRKSDIYDKNLNLLPILVSIADYGSLSEASRKLNISQSALSQSLAKLRHEFDDALFVRASHGLIPTDRAVRILEKIRPLLTSLDGAYQSDDDDFSKVSRSFCIASTTYFELHMLAPLMKILRAQAPNVRLSTISLQGELPTDELSRGEYDIAIAAYFSELPDSLRARKLQSDPIVCLVRKKHPYLTSKNKLKFYLAAEHLSIDIPPNSTQTVDLALRAMGEKRKIACRINNFLTPPLLLNDSDYIITCPSSLAKKYSDFWGLEIAPPPLKTAPIVTSMIWHERSQGDRFLKWIRGLIGEMLLEESVA